MAIPKYIQRWYDSLPEEEKRRIMESLNKPIEETLKKWEEN